MITRQSRILQTLAVAGIAGLALSACSAGGGGTAATDDSATETAAEESTEESTEAAGDVPSWCGPEEITFGLLDGFGGNSWRLVTTASGEEEAKKCPSVTEYLYADGQGDTQKSHF